MLNDQEKNKFTIIKKLENGEITRKKAADELKISLRQVDRLRINYLVKKALFIKIKVKYQ